jgi:hypothetical protein
MVLGSAQIALCARPKMPVTAADEEGDEDESVLEGDVEHQVDVFLPVRVALRVSGGHLPQRDRPG